MLQEASDNVTADLENLPKPLSETSPGYFRYSLILLTVIYTLNLFDRQILNILAEPIKNELKLADWQIGAVSGLAFALFYTTMGIVIARLAERHSRPYIIAASLTCWSGFTAVCGLVQGFLSLFFARVGVGVGEAGCTPTAHSLIAEYSARAKLASAMAFYHLGGSFGLLLGLGLGGWLYDAFGWRMAFVVAGIPGLAMAVIAVTTLIEPRKSVIRAPRDHVSLSEVFRFLLTRRTFWFMSLAAAAQSFVIYGRLQFLAPYFFRVHPDSLEATAALFGMKPAGFLGVALGLCAGLAGLLGTWMGGKLVDRLSTNDARAFGSVPAIAALLSVPLFVAAILVPDIPTSLALIFLSFIGGMLWLGPKNAAIMSVAPISMRATCSALSLLMESLIGMGLGPLCTGLMSDILAGPGGLGPAEGVRWALILSSSVGIVAAGLFWTTRRTIDRDFQHP